MSWEHGAVIILISSNLGAFGVNILILLIFQEGSMVEDCNCFIVIHHAQVVRQVVRPRNPDSSDSTQVQRIELLFELDMAMCASWRGRNRSSRSWIGGSGGAIRWRRRRRRAVSWMPRKISMYEFGQGSAAPSDGSPSEAFVRKVAKFDHKEKTSNEINGIVMLFLICGSQKIRHLVADLFPRERLLEKMCYVHDI
jgi:hypothetical protein